MRLASMLVATAMEKLRQGDKNKGRHVKNGSAIVPISFWKRKQNIFVSFPNFYYRKQIVSIWSRICSPGPIRNDLFRRIRERTQSVFVSCLLDIGTFVERLWNVCGTFVERLWNVCGTFAPLLFLHCLVPNHLISPCIK